MCYPLLILRHLFKNSYTPYSCSQPINEIMQILVISMTFSLVGLSIKLLRSSVIINWNFYTVFREITFLMREFRKECPDRF